MAAAVTLSAEASRESHDIACSDADAFDATRAAAATEAAAAVVRRPFGRATSRCAGDAFDVFPHSFLGYWFHHEF